jgi:hypothetical protein
MATRTDYVRDTSVLVMTAGQNGAVRLVALSSHCWLIQPWMAGAENTLLGDPAVAPIDLL